MWGNRDPAHAARLAEQGLQFGPPPAWALDRPVPQAPADKQGSLHFLLSDTQIDVTGERAWSYRVVQQALNSDGVGQCANFSVSFDPSCERVTVHRVRVLRNGQAIDLAEADAFQLLRRETNLERRLYDGRLTADMQIPDLRPGDVVDTWYTWFGSNPVIQGAFDGRFSFGWAAPVEQTCLRIRGPTGRRFAVRTAPEDWAGPAYSETTNADGSTDREWSAERLKVFRYDDATPSWWVGHARVDVVDEFVWSDIADMFRAAYAPPAELPPPLEAEIARIAAAYPDAPDRIVEALRWIQREIRYLAVSIGNGGHIPRQVDQIWARRFGDCKDVSLLLATMLRRLGIDATPALVNTDSGEILDREIPRPHAFNHCIVRVRHEGKTWWLDGTNAEQGGDLQRLFQPDVGWALPLEPSAVLERTGRDNPERHVIEASERLTFGPRADSPATLFVESVYRDWKADQMRSSIRREGIDRHQEGWLKHYAHNYRGAAVLEPARVQDDLAANVMVITELYRLERPWEIDGQVARFTSQDDIFRPDITVLPYPGRNQPLMLGGQRRYTRRTTFDMPNVWTLNAWDDDFSAPGLKARSTLSRESDKRLVLNVDYRITSPHINPPELDGFRDAIEKFRGASSVILTHAVKNGAFKKPTKTSNSSWIAVVIFLLLMAAARVWATYNPG